MMIDSNPNFRKAYMKSNEILASSNVITQFPFSAKELIKETSNIVCRSFNIAHKYKVNIEDFGSKSAIIMSFGNKDIIFYNSKEIPERVKFSMLHELGHKVNNHPFENVTEKMYRKVEVETNYFAAQLLMPEQIIREFQRRGERVDKQFLIRVFGVSEQAASKRIETLNKIIWERNENEKYYDDIILDKYMPWIDSIVPKNKEYLFINEEEIEYEREKWRYN